MEQKQKKLWGGIAGAVVIILIAALVWWANGGSWSGGTVSENDGVLSGNGTEQMPPSETTEPPAEPPPTSKPRTVAPPNSQSYTDALKKYGSNRIQFDSSCQAQPSTVVYKSGTQVMFDNRSAETRKIVFNGKTYTIGAWNYIVVSMTNKTYPAVAYIDCGSSQNVAKVTIEK